MILDQILNYLISNKPVLAGDKREFPEFVFNFLKSVRDSSQIVSKKMTILSQILTQAVPVWFKERLPKVYLNIKQMLDLMEQILFKHNLAIH